MEELYQYILMDPLIGYRQNSCRHCLVGPEGGKESDPHALQSLPPVACKGDDLCKRSDCLLHPNKSLVGGGHLCSITGNPENRCWILVQPPWGLGEKGGKGRRVTCMGGSGHIYN